MQKNLKFLIVLLALSLLLGTFASCAELQHDPSAIESSSNSEISSDEEQSTSENLASSENESSAITEGHSTEATETETLSEQESENTTQSEAEITQDSESGSETETETEPTPTLSGEHAELVENANSLKNNVNAYFGDGSREDVFFENMNMSLNHTLASDKNPLVNSVTNKDGAAYITDTMDVFIRMTNGKTYYSSNSSADAIFNIHRFGYYFYQMRVEGLDFIGGITPESTLDVNIESFITNYIKACKYRNGMLVVKNETGAIDPQIIFSDLTVDTEKYKVLELSIKADSNTSANADAFYIAGSATGMNANQRLRFSLITDGEWHTYRIPLYSGEDYTGNLSLLRLDISGSDASYEIKDVKFLELDISEMPSDLKLCRTFNVYGDKMHQVIQVAATSASSNIEAVGMLTEIAADTVAKLVVKDAAGLHYTLDGVDWASAEYVGFDIIDAGIFGYILPFDGKGGSIKVTLVDNNYVIEQTMSPENGTIIPSRTDYNVEMNYYNWVEGGNTNDLYMGQRIYTDPSHDFAEFLKEAYCERNPLSEDNFKVISNSSTGASYEGYDSLRGIYTFKIGGANGFNDPYYINPNLHYRANFVVVGDDQDRRIYAMTHFNIGMLECAVLLDKNDVLLPVPMEVGKNFAEQGGERNLFNLADFMYSETIFPLVINAKEKYEYTVLNLYQNWGNYPLKQLSWIQYYSPYYHLSTGVTETNCVLPWTFTNQIWYNTLPDFRGMSAPLWETQPQHTSCGEHDWLRYVDSEGNVVRTECRTNTIDSYGPTYADVKMDYITYDGKIKVSYTHTEMPQTDENRTYYEIKYEILEDVTVNDVVNNLQLYCTKPNDPVGKYKRLGYLNTENQCVVTAANESTTPVKYTLGDACPYFSFFDMDGHSSTYSNLAFLIYNSEFIIGGEKASPAFAIVNHTDTVYVTLDLETLTLKAGDSITINCILLPWGSELLDDGITDPENGNYEYDMLLDDGTQYMDKNVRDVRENSLLSPLLAEAVENCEVMESVFVPKLRTTNGESAVFTLKGGYNNVAVRIYGFEKMTVPVIYELIDGNWVNYNVSSSESKKDPHRYDGYMIHYDGDGTFSYSFVTDMDGETERTFKIVADGNYEAWDKEIQPEKIERPDKLNVYVDCFEIGEESDSLQEMQFISSSQLFEDEEFIRLFGAGHDAKYAEGYCTVYKDDSASKEGGKYVAVKYRLSADNAETVNRFDFYLSTTVSSAANSNAVFFNNVKNDGEWHTFIIDLEKVATLEFKEHFVAADDGKYYPKIIRFDFFDRRMSTDSYIDIAFVGMHDSYSEIAELSKNCASILLIEGSDIAEIDPATGERIDRTVELPENFVDPTSGYTEASLEYGAQIDKINGASLAIQGGSLNGVTAIPFFDHAIADKSVTNSAKVEGYNLVFGGWCVVEGGVDRYVWSADGGKTWHTVSSYNLSPRAAEEAMITASAARSNKTYDFTLDADSVNGNFQGAGGNNPTGIAACLEDYKGETVDVILGAVPKKDTSSILPLFYIAGVEVAE